MVLVCAPYKLLGATIKLEVCPTTISIAVAVVGTTELTETAVHVGVDRLPVVPLKSVGNAVVIDEETI